MKSPKKTTKKNEDSREGFSEGIKKAHEDMSGFPLKSKVDDEYVSMINEKQEVCPMCPIVISVKNKTDEKLYNIPILDYNNEFSEKVEFSSDVSTVSYKEILAMLKTCGISVNLVRIHSFGDYQKNVSKQLWQSYICSTKTIDGKITLRPVRAVLDPMQQQSNIGDLILHGKIGIVHYSIHNIVMNHLMPETTSKFIIYPTPTTNIK